VGSPEGVCIMAKQKKRRTRTEHSGVKIVRRVRNGRESWFARYRDPDRDNKERDLVLDPLAIPTREARRVWAIRKAKALAARRMELSLGAPTVTETPIDQGIADYLTTNAIRLRPRTLSTYKEAIETFRTWLGYNAVYNVEQITKGKLAEFRSFLTMQKKTVTFSGSYRGERRKTDKAKSPYSINRDLHSVKALVNHWRSRELLPSLDKDGISDALKNVPTAKEAPAYLSPSDCRKLLEAAIRHDNEVFTITRDEHDGLKPLGSTPRYEPITPFVLFLLLTGCRLGEGLNLRWTDIDLDALDAEGRKVGEIRLQATQTKTRQYRTIGLEVCPSLRTLLASMKLKTGANAYVFGGKTPRSKDSVESARKRLLGVYGAPRFSWQNLRQTTGTFLTNAPGIFGSASVFMSARQLGHSVTVAEKHYLGVVRGIPREARTLEKAMQVEDLVRKKVEGIGVTSHSRRGHRRCPPFKADHETF
jgi:integrase